MRICFSNWEFNISLRYREKRKPHNILNARRKSEKRLQVSEYKKQVGCEKCGYKDNPDILHFHHIDPIYKIGNPHCPASI